MERQERTREGIPLSPEVRDKLAELAREAGITWPEQ